MAYTSLANVKAYLGIATGTTADDALLTSLMASAQAIIDGHCDRTFEASADTTRYFDALCDTDDRTLYLDRDLCAITSITNGDGATVASTEYTTTPRNNTPWFAITLKRNSDVYWRYDDDAEDAIAVVGRWAYSLTAPADVAQATIRLTAYLHRQKDNAGDLDRPVLVSGSMTILPPQLPKDLVQILIPYVRHTGA